MAAFRDRYAEIEGKGAEVIAVSMDDAETLARFKKDLNAPFSFIPDTTGRIATLFGSRGTGSKYADRNSFVIGEGMQILAVEKGMFAIDPDQAVASCPVRRKKAAPDAGTGTAAPAPPVDAGTKATPMSSPADAGTKAGKSAPPR